MSTFNDYIVLPAHERQPLRIEYGHVINRYESPESHSDFQISTVENGYGTFYIRGQKHYIDSSTCIFIPQGEKHSGHLTGTNGKLLRQSIYFDSQALHHLTQLVKDNDKSETLSLLPAASNIVLTTQIRRTIAAFMSDDDLLERETLLLYTIAELLRCATDAPLFLPKLRREHQVVNLLRRYIEVNATDKITLDDLAQHVWLNKFYLLKVFQYETGLTPSAYQTHVRLRYAKQMLRAGLSAHEVALRAGFTDQSHLIRAFKRHLYITPGWYQRQVNHASHVLIHQDRPIQA